MKKINRLILFAALPTLLELGACSRTEDPIYGESPTERLNTYLSDVQAALVKPANGWEMRVYPSEKKEWGGYTIWAKFDAEGNVVTASEVYGADETFSSAYKLDGSNQPMLTFDVFNKAIHLFSAPNLTALIAEDKADKGEEASRITRFADASPARGLDGDYALRVLSMNDDEIVLVGSRTGVRYVMTPASDTPWSEQVATVQSMSDKYALPLIKLAIGNTEYTGRMRFSRRQLILTNDKGEDFVTVPYRHTTTGLELYEPLTLEGVSFQTLIADASATVPTLKSADGAVTLLANLQPLNIILTEAVDVWDIVDNFEAVAMNGRFAEGFGIFEYLPMMMGTTPHSVLASSVGMLRNMGMGFGVIIVTQNNTNMADMQMTFIPLKVTLVEGTTDEVEFALDLDRLDPSSEAYMQSHFTYLLGLGFANFGDFHIFADTPEDYSPRRFRLETDNAFSPSWIKIIDKSDEENWIQVKRAVTSTSD